VDFVVVNGGNVNPEIVFGCRVFHLNCGSHFFHFNQSSKGIQQQRAATGQALITAGMSLRRAK
jgi:hypothetical protein